MNKTTAITSISALGATSGAFGITNHITAPVTLDTSGKIWFLEGGTSGTALGSFYGTLTTSFTTASFPSSGFNGFRFADSSYENVKNLSLGAAITAGLFTGSDDGFVVSATSYGSFGYDWGNFTPDTAANAAFRYDNGNGTQFGWVNLTWTLNADSFATLTLNEWAYTTEGESIAVNQTAVPEPNAAAPLALLALGAAGFRRYRRQAA